MYGGESPQIVVSGRGVWSLQSVLIGRVAAQRLRPHGDGERVPAP